MAADNRLLNQFNLDGIPPAPRGMPQIEVKFDIDANGILSVTAKDLGNGKEQTITIENDGALTEEEIERMKADAEEHAEEDKKKRELVDAKNKAEAMAFETEKLIKEHGEKLDEAGKKAIEDSIEKTKEAAKGEDAAAINSAVEELEAATHALSKAMYDAAAAEGGEPATAGATAGASSEDDEEIQDADFEVKKD